MATQFLDALFEPPEFVFGAACVWCRSCENYSAGASARSIEFMRQPRPRERCPGEARHTIVDSAPPASLDQSPHNYAEIQRLLAEAHALTEPAEAHGTLAGALCAARCLQLEDWLAEILPEARCGGRRGACTARPVCAIRCGALRGRDMEFDLLMPDDERRIEERTRALCLWCNGFLYGLGDQWRRRPARACRPMPAKSCATSAEITRAGVDAADAGGSERGGLAELVEFVRVGVQLVFEELARARCRRRAPGFHDSAALTTHMQEHAMP